MNRMHFRKHSEAASSLSWLVCVCLWWGLVVSCPVESAPPEVWKHLSRFRVGPGDAQVGGSALLRKCVLIFFFVLREIGLAAVCTESVGVVLSFGRWGGGGGLRHRLQHQWILGNHSVRHDMCIICGLPCGSLFKISGLHCVWCQANIHKVCSPCCERQTLTLPAGVCGDGLL